MMTTRISKIWQWGVTDAQGSHQYVTPGSRGDIGSHQHPTAGITRSMWRSETPTRQGRAWDVEHVEQGVKFPKYTVHDSASVSEGSDVPCDNHMSTLVA